MEAKKLNHFTDSPFKNSTNKLATKGMSINISVNIKFEYLN